MVGLGMGGSLGFVEEGVAQEEGARCSGVNGEGATRDGAPCGSGAVEAAGLAVEAAGLAVTSTDYVFLVFDWCRLGFSPNSKRQGFSSENITLASKAKALAPKAWASASEWSGFSIRVYEL